MTFSLPGFDQWSFQIVMLGSLLVLEALKDDLKLSTVLETQLRAWDGLSWGWRRWFMLKELEHFP